MSPRIASLVVLAGALSAQNPTWVDRTSSPQPNDGLNLAIAYHAVDKKTYVFGSSSRNETWTWDGNVWKAVGVSGPSGGHYHRMTYDAKRNRLVLVSSPSNSSPFTTWEWGATKWVQQNPAGATPPPGYGYEVAFDSRRGVTVMFGGAYSNWTRADTWEYDGTRWVQRSSGGPPHRIYFGMAYDEARGETIVFGGLGIRNSNNLYYKDTWVWNGTYWREHFGVAGPGVRTYSRMTYDPARKRVILYGGVDRATQNFVPDTWEWHGAKWAKIPVTKAPVTSGALTFDIARGVAVLKTYDSRNSRTWEYLYRPPARASFTSFGTGCASTVGIPKLAARSGQLPRIGGGFGLEVTVLPATQFTRVMGIVGSSATKWGNINLPLDLTFLGMPGCRLLVAHEYSPMNLPIQSGTAKWNLMIPNNPALAGGAFYLQAMVLEPGVNTFGAVMSNAGAGRLGY